MGIAERRARERQELRSKIIKAATDLFVNEGMASVSMRRIADAIEYSPATIYGHFKDKDELLSVICEEAFTKLDSAIDAIVAEGLPPLDSLRKALLAYVEFGVKNPSAYLVTFCPPPAATDLSEETSHRIEAAGRASLGRLVIGLQACVDSGDLPPMNTALAATTVWMLLHGVTSLLICKCVMDDFTPDVLVESTLDHIIRGLKLQNA